MNAKVMWHDVECGGYVADLPLWRRLAREAGGPVLDVGAGTGRVALDLARAGHEVTALDIDPELLAELEARADGLPVRTMVADAAGFDAGDLRPGGGADADDPAAPRPARASSPPRGAPSPPADSSRSRSPSALEPFEREIELPQPDTGEADGWRYLSQPTAVRETDGGMRIERLRHTIGPAGERATEANVDRARAR